MWNSDEDSRFIFLSSPDGEHISLEEKYFVLTQQQELAEYCAGDKTLSKMSEHAKLPKRRGSVISRSR